MRFDPKFPCPQLTFCRLVEMKCRYRAFFTTSEWAFHLPWVLWTRGQQPSRSRILPSCDQYTCLPCDSLALENKLELSCVAFPGKFNELQERNVANYSMPNFPHLFIYLFLNSSICWRFSFFIYFVSLFSGFHLPQNSWLKLSMTSFNRYAAHLFLLFWRISWETATYFCFTTRVENSRNATFFTPYSRFTCLISSRKYIDISKSVIYSRRAACRKM